MIKSVSRQVFMLSMFITIVALLNACSSEGPYRLPAQQWNDAEFVVEIRPGAPTMGMNEFLVMVTDKTGVPGYQYVISLRFKGDEKWIQSIQDGHSGVYRRAINVKDPVNGILEIKADFKAAENSSTIMEFPISGS